MTGQLKNLVIYAAIIMALTMLSFLFLGPFVSKNINGIWSGITNTAVTLLILSPFLWAMAFKYNISLTTKKLLTNNKFSRTIIYFIFILRFIIALSIIYIVISHYIDLNFWADLGIAFLFTIILMFSNHAMRFYQRLEDHFMNNLNKRQSQASFVVPEILQENFHLEKMIVSPNSQVIGKRLMDTAFRSQYNVSVVSIERGNKIFDLPPKDMAIYPYDKITVVGNDEKINILRPIIEVENEVLIRERINSNVNLHNTHITNHDPIYHVSLKNSRLKENYNAMVIAIERCHQFILNPPATTIFENDDIVWFVCDDENASRLIHVETISKKNHC